MSINSLGSNALSHEELHVYTPFEAFWFFFNLSFEKCLD